MLDFINKGQQNAAKRMKNSIPQIDVDVPVDNSEKDDDFLTLIEKASREGIHENAITDIWGDYMNPSTVI